MLYGDFFTTIHKHLLFITTSCRTTFRLLTHVSLLQYSRSSNMLAFRRTLANISAGYPCISFSWTHWVKKNNRPNYSQELKRVLAWPSSHYSYYPWSFYVFMGNLVVHDVVVSLIYFYFIYRLFYFINLKDICVYVMLGNAQVLEEELNLLWPSFLGMVFHMLLAFYINLIDSKCCIQYTYVNFFVLIVLCICK